MTPDAWDALATKLVAMLLTSAATYTGATGDQNAAIASGVGAALAVAYGIYKHYGMKKVPAAATVLKP